MPRSFVRLPVSAAFCLQSRMLPTPLPTRRPISSARHCATAAYFAAGPPSRAALAGTLRSIQAPPAAAASWTARRRFPTLARSSITLPTSADARQLRRSVLVGLSCRLDPEESGAQARAHFHGTVPLLLRPGPLQPGAPALHDEVQGRSCEERTARHEMEQAHRIPPEVAPGCCRCRRGGSSADTRHRHRRMRPVVARPACRVDAGAGYRNAGHELLAAASGTCGRRVVRRAGSGHHDNRHLLGLVGVAAGQRRTHGAGPDRCGIWPDRGGAATGSGVLQPGCGGPGTVLVVEETNSIGSGILQRRDPATGAPHRSGWGISVIESGEIPAIVSTPGRLPAGDGCR
jgi:hypothetical protein